jgi:hypothetical protein
MTEALCVLIDLHVDNIIVPTFWAGSTVRVVIAMP